MNKLLKVVLIIASISISLGIIICIAVGAATSWSFFRGDWRGFGFDNAELETVNMDFTDKIGDIKKLELYADIGDVKIVSGDTLSIKGEDILKSTMRKTGVKGSTLFISQEYNNFNGFHFFGLNVRGHYEPTITITIPNNMIFESAYIEAGLGNWTISDLKAQNCNLSLGAGNISLDKLSGEKLTVDGGLGDIVMNDINITSADFNLGAGEVDVAGIIAGNIDVDCGLGSINFDLTGATADDYDFDIDQGLGDVSINGNHVGDYSTNKGTYRFNVDGGAGDVSINIEE